MFWTIRSFWITLAGIGYLHGARGDTFSGDLTAYGASTNGGFCGFNSESWLYRTDNKLMTAAINQPQQSNSLACGRCAAVTYRNKTHVILVDNLCPECKQGDLDLSQEAWQVIVGGTNYGREKASWSWSECTPLMNDQSITIRAHHVNEWWLAVNPSNFKCGMRKMWIEQSGKWVEMDRDNQKMNGLWFIRHAKIEYPFRFRMESILGDTVETPQYTSIQNIFPRASTGVQFKCPDCSNAPTPKPTPACNLRH